MTFMFPYIGNVIIPTDELIFFFFQRGRAQPPTRYSLANLGESVDGYHIPMANDDILLGESRLFQGPVLVSSLVSVFIFKEVEAPGNAWSLWLKTERAIMTMW